MKEQKVESTRWIELHVGPYQRVSSNLDRVAIKQYTAKIHVGATAHCDVVTLQLAKK